MSVSEIIKSQFTSSTAKKKNSTNQAAIRYEVRSKLSVLILQVEDLEMLTENADERTAHIESMRENCETIWELLNYWRKDEQSWVSNGKRQVQISLKYTLLNMFLVPCARCHFIGILAITINKSMIY